MKAVRNLLIYIFSTYLLVMFGFNAAQDFWCSTLVKGVIYGSYSVSEMFPKNFTNCTWTLENPDPTKYSIYLKFSKKDFSCSNFSLLAYQFDHFSHEKIKDLLKNNHSIMQLCDSKNAFVFLQYDKNFIQIRRVYPIDFPGLHKKEDDQKSFFEFLVLNKVSPSQFGCHVLCTWLESCLKSENGRTESCGIMYTKCTCPQHLGEWGIDDQSLVLLNNVVLPLNEQTEGCLTQELQTTQVCNLSREVKRPPKEGRCCCWGVRVPLPPQPSPLPGTSPPGSHPTHLTGGLIAFKPQGTAAPQDMSPAGERWGVRAPRDARDVKPRCFSGDAKLWQLSQGDGDRLGAKSLALFFFSPSFLVGIATTRFLPWMSPGGSRRPGPPVLSPARLRSRRLPPGWPGRGSARAWPGAEAGARVPRRGPREGSGEVGAHG